MKILRRDDRTLTQARAYVEANLDTGVQCPCCDQHAKIYRRNIYSSMARHLIVAFNVHGTSWFYVTDFRREYRLAEDGTFGKLSYWGLVEEERERKGDGGRSGWWRVTDRGAQFVRREIRVPKYMLVYNARVVGVDDSVMVGLEDCLGKNFRYDELMSA